ncbi:MAG: hypothetical protein ABSA63_06890 [Thermoplasmata archaeon]
MCEEFVAPVRFERAQHGEYVGERLLAPLPESAPGLLYSPAIDGEHGNLPAEPVEGLPSGHPDSRGSARGKVGELEEIDVGSRKFNPAKPRQQISRPPVPL